MFGVSSKRFLIASLVAASASLPLQATLASAAVDGTSAPMMGRLVPNVSACRPGDFMATRSMSGAALFYTPCPGGRIGGQEPMITGSIAPAVAQPQAANIGAVAAGKSLMVSGPNACAPGKYWMMSNPNGERPIPCS